MNIYQKKKEHYSLIYLLDKLDNLFEIFNMSNNKQVFYRGGSIVYNNTVSSVLGDSKNCKFIHIRIRETIDNVQRELRNITFINNQDYYKFPNQYRIGILGIAIDYDIDSDTFIVKNNGNILAEMWLSDSLVMLNFIK